MKDIKMKYYLVERYRQVLNVCVIYVMILLIIKFDLYLKVFY